MLGLGTVSFEAVKVLIVDDNSKVRELLRVFLPPEVDEVYECDDGAKALRLFELHRPDWILMDWEMRDMDGISATKEIIRKYPDAQVCMVTNFDIETLRSEAFDAGVRQFVVKDKLYRLSTILGS